LRKSAIDESTLLHDVNHDLVVGFHAQQSIEKLFKALLTELGRTAPYTHDLERLEVELTDAGENLPKTPMLLRDLNEYAVEYRYEEPLLPIVMDRAKLIETVRILREFVHQRVAELNQPNL
jgi:HEPN domain-containing protein